MEHDFSFNKQLRKQITGRAVLNKKIKFVKADIDKIIDEIFNVDIEIKRIKQLVPKRRKKN